MNTRDPFQLPIAGLLCAVAFVVWLGADYFGMELIAEIAILAIFAMSLDLLVGTAGMVSLGHAGFLALGAYATAAATVLWGWPPFVALGLSVVVATVVALTVGIFAVRLTGAFFIMITLAIGQIVYAYFVKARVFGGDNGMSGTPRLDLVMLGLDANEPGGFAALSLIAALLVYMVLLTVRRSPFGMMLYAIRQNPSRLASLGCPVRLYKLAAFGLSGAVAGLSGGIMAQHTGFVSPDLAFWTLSGEVLIIVIIGGSGSLIGAAGGAALFILLRNQLNDAMFWEALSLPTQMAKHWHLVMGLFFICVVLLARDGLYGRISSLISRGLTAVNAIRQRGRT